MTIEERIRRVAHIAQCLLDQSYSVGEPAPGSALDQAGLRNGLAIVEDYLAHNEAGVAFEHLMYMVYEPSLPLPATTITDLSEVAGLLGMSHEFARRFPT